LKNLKLRFIQNKINSFQSNENKTPHDKSFKGQNELMNQYKEMHKFRCGKYGIFFEIKEEMDDHFRICEKNELKDNKNKYSEFVFHDGEITPIQNRKKSKIYLKKRN